MKEYEDVWALISGDVHCGANFGRYIPTDRIRYRPQEITDTLSRQWDTGRPRAASFDLSALTQLFVGQLPPAGHRSGIGVRRFSSGERQRVPSCNHLRRVPRKPLTKTQIYWNEIYCFYWCMWHAYTGEWLDGSSND